MQARLEVTWFALMLLHTLMQDYQAPEEPQLVDGVQDWTAYNRSVKEKFLSIYTMECPEIFKTEKEKIFKLYEAGL